MKRVTRDRV